VHVQAADDVAMACECTLGVPAHPIPPTNFLAALAARTLARGAPFGAGEAHDASSCTLLREIVLVLTVFPLAHTLVVVASAPLIPHPVRVPNEDGLHPLLLEEAHHLPRRLVASVSYLPLGACPQPGFGALEAPKAARAPLATRLLPLTTSPWPVVVVTAARWISPRSMVACAVPSASVDAGAGKTTCNS
jgi:hypothetical protein